MCYARAGCEVAQLLWAQMVAVKVLAHHRDTLWRHMRILSLKLRDDLLCEHHFTH